MAESVTDAPMFDLGPAPPMPQPRSLSDEMGALMPMLGDLAMLQSQINIEAQKEMTRWQTQFGYRFYEATHDELLADELGRQRAAAFNARTAALDWLQWFGPQATAAYEASNPRLMAELDRLGGVSAQMAAERAKIGQRPPISALMDQQAMAQLKAGGPTTQFTALLDQQALNELKLGGALTPEQERIATQGARTAYAARGMALGNPAALTEVLNRESMSAARLRERQQIAAGRETGALNRMQLGQAYGAARENAALQWREADRGFLLGSAGWEQQTVGLLNALNPNNMILGLPYQVPNIMGATQQFSAPQTQPSVGPVISSGLAYGSDLFNTNTNMAASMYNSYQNNLAALQGAQIQANAQIQAAQLQAGAMGGSSGGGIAGAAIGAAGSAASAAVSAAFCWVAREVFGEGDKRWRTFRVWLVLEAPRALRELYAEHGEAIAARIRGLPHIKAALRQIMEPLAV